MGDFLNVCKTGDIDKVQELVDQGADIHVVDNAPLILAIIHGHLEVVKYLVVQGADIHGWNDAPLRLAVTWGHLNVAIYLRNVAGSKWKCHDCLLKSTCLELCDEFRK